MTSYEKLKAKLSIYEELIEDLDADLMDMIKNPNAFAEEGETFNESEKKLMKNLSHYFMHQIYLKLEEIWKLKK